MPSTGPAIASATAAASDRTLAELAARGRRPLSIGVGFELGFVETTLPQPHDQRLDWIVTERQTLRCS